MGTLFISDLHLDPSRPAVTALFLDFLRREGASAERLYILGDLFEAWIGDDDPDPHHAQVIAALRELTASGVPVSFMRGNRDFLIGTDFAHKTGIKLLADPTVADLYGIPTLLMHGDSLCADDVEYQKVRKRFREPGWQRDFLAKSIQERRAFAAQARAESRSRTAAKAEYIMDVNQAAVARTMQEHGVRRLIHGHTHRPAVHHFVSGGIARTRIVLGDWHEEPSCLRWQGPSGVLEDPRISDGEAD